MKMQKSYFSPVWIVMFPMIAVILLASADTINRPFHKDSTGLSKTYSVYKTNNPADSEARLKELARKCYPEKFKNVK